MFVYEKVFKQVKLSRDGQEFKCLAEMGDLQVLEHTFTLEISQIATFVISDAEKYYKAGSKVALVCTANKKLGDGNKISWWREEEGDDVEIKEVSNSIVIKEVRSE